MRDWNLRVILRQIWAEQGVSHGGWAIQRDPGEIDGRFWARQRSRDPSTSTRRVGRRDARAARSEPRPCPPPRLRRTRRRPYLGLVPYAEADADWFFGRDEWCDDRRATTCARTGSRSSTARAASARARCCTRASSAGSRDEARENVADPARRGCCRSSFSAWSLDDPLAALKDALLRSRGRASVDRVARRRARRLGRVRVERPAAARPRPVRGVLPLPRALAATRRFDELATRSIAGATCRALPALDPRGRARASSTASRARPGPARATAADRPPRPGGRARGDRRPARALEPRCRRPATRSRSSRRWSKRCSTRSTAGGCHSATAGAPPARDRRPDRGAVPPARADAALGRGAAGAGRTRARVCATLERLGGAERIVRTHLDAALGGLPSRDAGRRRPRVFRYLVTPSGTKIAHRVADLAEYAGVSPEAARAGRRTRSPGDVRILRPAGDGALRDLPRRPRGADPRLAARWDERQRAAASGGGSARVGAVLVSLVAIFATGWASGPSCSGTTPSGRRRATVSLLLARAEGPIASWRTIPTGESLLLGLAAYREHPGAELARSIATALETARQSGGRGSDPPRPSQTGVRTRGGGARVQPGPPHPRHRRLRRDGPALGREGGHRPLGEPIAARVQGRDLGPRLQPGRAHARVRRQRRRRRPLGCRRGQHAALPAPDLHVGPMTTGWRSARTAARWRSPEPGWRNPAVGREEPACCSIRAAPRAHLPRDRGRVQPRRPIGNSGRHPDRPLGRRSSATTRPPLLHEWIGILGAGLQQGWPDARYRRHRRNGPPVGRAELRQAWPPPARRSRHRVRRRLRPKRNARDRWRRRHCETVGCRHPATARSTPQWSRRSGTEHRLRAERTAGRKRRKRHDCAPLGRSTLAGAQPAHRNRPAHRRRRGL